MASKLVRLSNICVVRFEDISKRSLFSSDIYALKFENNVQLLTPDGTLNSVDNSYSPYIDNILLRRTPYPWFSTDYLIDNRLSQHVSPNCPDIEYQKISINYIAGYNYSSDDYLSMTRFYYIIDDKYELTVSSIVDYKSNTQFKPNSVNIVLDSAIFNTSLDTEIINIQQLFQSNDPEIILLKEHMFGTDTKSCSELFIEQSIIQETQILEFENNNKTFQKFFIEDLNRSYYNRSLDLGEELFIDIQSRTNSFDKHISIKLEHSKFDIEAYLSKYLHESDSWDIKYEVTQSAYDSNDNLISSISQYMGNFNSPFMEIITKPIITDDWFNDNNILTAAYCTFDVRCIARTSVSNLEITRYGKIIINDLLTYFLRPIVNEIVGDKIYSRKEIINHQVSMKSELPEVIQVVKPYFVFTQPSDKIQLTPFATTIGIEFQLPKNIIYSTIVIKFDTREYKCLQYEDNKLLFQIPGNEYMNSTKTYYIMHKDLVLSHGGIERIK